jgi:hypothetical protein
MSMGGLALCVFVGLPIISSSGIVGSRPPPAAWAACDEVTAAVAPPPAGGMVTAVGDDASFTVKVGGQTWLRSAPIRAYVEGAWHAPSHSGTTNAGGTDPVLGPFSSTNVSWLVGPSRVPLHTSVRVFHSGDAALFITELPEGASGTNASNPILPQTWQPATGKDGQGLTSQGHETPPQGLPNNTQWTRYHDNGIYPPSLAFPAFSSRSYATEAQNLLPTLGFVTWADCQVPSLHGTNVTDSLGGLSMGGPVVLFQRGHHSAASLVVSPIDNLKSVVHTLRSDNGSGGAWETGVNSEIASLPAGFYHRTLLTFRRDGGITAAMHAWGRTVRAMKGTDRSFVAADPVNFLSYWTDNGVRSERVVPLRPSPPPAPSPP